jgi:hypothetical protein
MNRCVPMGKSRNAVISTLNRFILSLEEKTLALVGIAQKRYVSVRQRYVRRPFAAFCVTLSRQSVTRPFVASTRAKKTAPFVVLVASQCNTQQPLKSRPLLSPLPPNDDDSRLNRSPPSSPRRPMS